MQVNEKYSIYVRGGAFKRGDTMRHIVISFQDEQGCWVTPNPDHTFVAKVANSTGYIGDYPVTVVDSDFIISTKVFAKLPDDKYELEIWEIWPRENNEDPDMTIYPTPETVAKFTIEANVTDKAGEVIKKIGFQDVVNAAVENAGLNLQVGNINELDVGEKPTVTQQYKDGKNILSFSFPKPRAATVTIDKVNTVAPDQPASVTNVGTTTDAKLVLNIPQGVQGVQRFRGPTRKNIEIKRTFKSVQEMNDSKGSGFEDGDLTVIASSVDDPDNAKLYIWDGTNFKYIADLSGAQGIKGDMGPAPALSVESVTKLPAGSQPTVTYKKVDGGYNVAYALPQGADGATWQPYINKDDGHWHIKLTQGLPAVTGDDIKRLQDFISDQLKTASGKEGV